MSTEQITMSPCIREVDLTPVVTLRYGDLALVLSPDQARALSVLAARCADEAEAGAKLCADPATKALAAAEPLGSS